MSINVIIVAVLALIILVVLVLIMTGKTKMFSSTVASCESKGAGAKCQSDKEPCDGPLYKFGTSCTTKELPWCCAPVA